MTRILMKVLSVLACLAVMASVVGAQGSLFTTRLAKLGKPALSESKNGIKAEVWLLTRAEHDRLLSMPGENRQLNDGSSDTGDESYKNTQHANSANSAPPNPEIAIVVLDDGGGKVPVQNMILEITAKSPSGVPLTKGLIAAHDHYATDLEFAEKGAYKLSLRITRDGRTTMMYFETPIIIS